MRYFNKSKGIYRSALQKLFTKSPNSKIAKNIILIILGTLIFLNMFLIYQQMNFVPCSLGFPESWDI